MWGVDATGESKSSSPCNKSDTSDDAENACQGSTDASDSGFVGKEKFRVVDKEASQEEQERPRPVEAEPEAECR